VCELARTNEKCVKVDPLRGRAAKRRKPPDVFYDWWFRQWAEWRESPFVARYGGFFEGYKQARFSSFELVVSLVIAAALGVTPCWLAFGCKETHGK
jgi:hypothetical protein